MSNLSSISWWGATPSAIGYNAVLDVEFSGENPVEPVTLQEAKDWCRIDINDDDALITSLITAARTICEKTCNISFITRTVTARLNNGLGGMFLPYGPVIGEITSIKNDDAIDIDSNNFAIKNSSFKQVYSPYNTVVIVVYNAGYTTLPGNLRTALLNQIAWMYDNRGEAAAAGKLSEQAKLILNQVKRV